MEGAPAWPAAMDARMPGSDLAGELRRVAALPAWLTDPVDQDLVGGALVRGVAEFVTGGATLWHLKVSRPMLDQLGWTIRYRVTVDDRARGRRVVPLVGR